MSPPLLAICGTGGTGKTALANYIITFAGGIPDEVNVETSAAIIRPAESLRKLLYHGRLGAFSQDLVTQAIPWHAKDWFNAATGNRYEIPFEAFVPGPRDQQLYQTLADLIDSVFANPELYSDEFTVNNKSTDLYRPIITAVGFTLGQMATRYVRINHVPGMTNIWNNVAMDEVIRRRSRYPNLPLQTVTGMRLPGDEVPVRESGGYVFKVVRRDQPDSNLPTEQGGIKADYVILNDASLLELELTALSIWQNLNGPTPIPAGDARQLEISCAQGFDPTRIIT
ncbi:MAG: hypothetical protein K0S68_655 [Candidatus Saccharibacteria bacterium]|jgi:hypothetical protein|nr:hypothetical protein [Candidatus Saccharibacteria bacterium]